MRRALALAFGLAAAGCGSSKTTPGPSPSPTPAQAPPAAPAPTGPGTVVTGRFHSDALGVDKAYRIYLPAGYDAAPARRYPAIYMLHGLGGNETDWTAGGGLAEVADAIHLQAIVVMPDGDSGFYADRVTPADPAACAAHPNPFGDPEPAATYCVATPRYETYVVRDLIAHVDATYRTIAERRGRGIGGLSMGGFGALALSMRHRDLFAAVVSHSGVDSLLYAGPFPYQPGKVQLLDDATQWGTRLEPLGGFVRGIFGPDLATWKAHDPATLAQALSDGDLAIYLDCGTEDGFGLNNHAAYLDEVLTARGVKHEFFLGPGRHDFRFWHDRLDDSLGFFARALAPAT